MRSSPPTLKQHRSAVADSRVTFLVRFETWFIRNRLVFWGARVELAGAGVNLCVCVGGGGGMGAGGCECGGNGRGRV